MDIREVAVIGAGGLSGLAALNELIHIDSYGKSTITESRPDEPFFTKIVGFEQKSDVGGTWNVGNYESDPGMPPQEILNTEKYNNINVLRPPNKNQPSDEELTKSTYENPTITEKDEGYLQWKNSPIYPRLYTNTPKSYMLYSTMHDFDDSLKELGSFITHQSVGKRLKTFANENQLEKLIRFNTEVIKAEKVGDKWVLTLRAYNEKQDFWYQESFDGLIIAQGMFSTPFIPHYKGLSQYVAKHKGSVLHAKAYRDPMEYKDKRVLIIGSNISAIDISQYLSSVAKEVIISRDLNNEPYLEYMARAIKTFKNVDKVVEFLPETKEIRIKDGTILKDIDYVILATGYHIKSSIFADDVLEYSTPVDNDSPSSNSRIKNIYQHTFNIKDPSITFVGRLVVQSNFKAAEAESAAIAGVWTGSKGLPSTEEQYEWEKKRVDEAGDVLFHKDDIYQIKDKFFGEMKRFYPEGRPDPLGHDLDDMGVYEKSLVNFEDLFNQFIQGKKHVYYEFK